jgi:hypothetical protein
MKEELPDQWKEPIVLPSYKKGDKSDCAIIVGCHCYQLHTQFYPISFSQGYIHTYMKLLGIIGVGFKVTDQLPIRYCAFVRYWKKNGSTMRQRVSYS